MHQACYYLLRVSICISQEDFYLLLENNGIKKGDEIISSGPIDPELSYQTENDHYHETTSQSPSSPSGITVVYNVHCIGDTEVDAAECNVLQTSDVPLYAVPDKLKSKVYSRFWKVYSYLVYFTIIMNE